MQKPDLCRARERCLTAGKYEPARRSACE